MKLSTLFILNAIFAAFGALSLLLMPDKIWASYGATLNDSGRFASQVLGTTVLGMAVLSYLAKDLKDQKAQRAILSSFIIVHTGSGLFALMATMTGILNQMGWIDIILHGAFAAGFAYYLFGKK